MKKLALNLIFHLGVVVGIGQGIIIDHSSTNFEEIPMSVIDDIQENLRFQYAHYSHGSQLLCGLQMIEDANSAYSVAIGGGYNGNNADPPYLPTEPGALCIYNGNCGYTIEDVNYWHPIESNHCTENTLNQNPTINVSGWQWCEQLNAYTEAETQEYLDAMTAYEQQFPNVTFVYMTSNAMAGGAPGYNRHLRCDQIRQYCIDNNKVLFDFEDLDAWYNGEHSTYMYNGEEVPYMHPAYNGNDCGHANDLNSLNKGRAVWMLMAKLRGYGATINNDIILSELQLAVNIYPNPTKNYLNINIIDYGAEFVTILLIDSRGQLIKREECKLIYGILSKRIYIEELNEGMYFVITQIGEKMNINKIIKT